MGTLTFGNNLSLGSGGSGKITLDLTNNPASGNDLINVSGTLILSGSTNVAFNTLSGYLLGGGTHYPLIHYGGISGDATNFAAPINDCARPTASVITPRRRPSTWW